MLSCAKPRQVIFPLLGNIVETPSWCCSWTVLRIHICVLAFTGIVFHFILLKYFSYAMCGTPQI